MRRRSLGNPTTKAWLAGWDAATVGLTAHVNPYKRRPQHDAWHRGHAAGKTPTAQSVETMKRFAALSKAQQAEAE